MLKRLFNTYNFRIIFPSLLIYFLGLLTIFSTTASLYQNHLIYFLLGVILFVVIQYIDIDFYIKYSIYFYFFVLFLLILIFIIGHTALGASRWLKVGDLSLQPSEFAKLASIFISSYIYTKITTWRFKSISITNPYLKSSLFNLPLIAMVLLQPDLGTSIVIVSIFMGLLLLSNFDIKYFILIFVLAGIFSTPLWNSLHDYQRQRVIIFINPELDPFGSGYNTIQAKIAVGSGGFFGKGFQKGTQSQLNFLPIFWTDFLVATFAEEWGFVGSVFLIICYFVLIYEIYRVFFESKQGKFKYVSFGILIYFTIQFIVNFGMNVGIFPVTGIPAPLFSYGGTSLVSSLILLGIINKISLDKSK